MWRFLIHCGHLMFRAVFYSQSVSRVLPHDWCILSKLFQYFTSLLFRPTGFAASVTGTYFQRWRAPGARGGEGRVGGGHTAKVAEAWTAKGLGVMTCPTVTAACFWNGTPRPRGRQGLEAIVPCLCDTFLHSGAEDTASHPPDPWEEEGQPSPRCRTPPGCGAGPPGAWPPPGCCGTHRTTRRPSGTRPRTCGRRAAYGTRSPTGTPPSSQRATPISAGCLLASLPHLHYRPRWLVGRFGGGIRLVPVANQPYRLRVPRRSSIPLMRGGTRGQTGS